MDTKTTGGPAFPRNADKESNGMALRDYFAAKAMQALVPIYESNPNFDLCAKAYQLADAMLKARGA